MLPCLLMVLTLFGCGQSQDVLVWNDYQKWVTHESNELKKVKKVNSLNISAQFLPADYLTFQELKRDGIAIDSVNYKSSKKNYQCGLTFRLMLEPEQKGVNLLYHKVSNMAEYGARVSTLSFDIDRFIGMRIGGKTYAPVLANYEGYNELNNRLIFTTVFQPEEFSCGSFGPGTEKVTLTFDDPFWSTGVNNFTYNTSTLTDVPQIIMN